MGHRLLVLPFLNMPTQVPIKLIVVGIKAHRCLGHLERKFKSFFEILRPFVVVIIGIGPGEAGVGAGIVRVDFLDCSKRSRAAALLSRVNLCHSYQPLIRLS